MQAALSRDQAPCPGSMWDQQALDSSRPQVPGEVSAWTWSVVAGHHSGKDGHGLQVCGQGILGEKEAAAEVGTKGVSVRPLTLGSSPLPSFPFLTPHPSSLLPPLLFSLPLFFIFPLIFPFPFFFSFLSLLSPAHSLLCLWAPY